MEQSKVVIYARFDTSVTQEYVDEIRQKTNSFIKMLGAELVKQHWEITQSNERSDKISNILDDCIKNGWSILTYDLKTLHKHQSGALSIVSEGAGMGVPIFFIDPESALKSIFSV